jgi:hypothetical protein
MPNISRKDMPQVDTQNLGSAIDIVSNTAKVTKGKIEAGKLKKSQKELHKDKIEGIAKKFTSPDKFKPLIISQDNHIVDGHHRWGAAIYKWGDNVKIPIFRIHLPIIKAIQLYKQVASDLNQPVKETIKKVDGKYVVYPKKGGDRLGTHSTKSAAQKQLAAIEISKHKNEDITIPINVGDTVLGGKFKNKPIVVKSIDKNEKGDITINGKPLLKFRLVKESNDQLEMMKLLNKAMKAFPGSPNQKKIKQELNKLRVKNGLKPIPESTAPNHDGKSAPYGSGYKKKNEIYFDRFGNKCKNPTTLDGRCIDKYRPSTTIREPLSEIPMDDLQKIDQFADKQLNPLDVVLTDKHFFDRLNDPRNGKVISNAELIGFFKRLSKKKKEFLDFLDTYKSLVAVDDRTNINIPFMKQANKAIAKTIMRKKDFKTPDKKLDI